jgi:sporulation protein YlmC with PRC-barrel domain
MGTSEKIHLVRDVLDKLLVDTDRMPLGRVDGIVLLIKGETRPQVVQLESGSATLARRLGSGFATVAQWILRRIGTNWTGPVRVEWAKVKQIGKEVMLEGTSQNSPLLARERWLRDHLIRYIPGNRIKKERE